MKALEFKKILFLGEIYFIKNKGFRFWKGYQAQIYLKINTPIIFIENVQGHNSDFIKIIHPDCGFGEASIYAFAEDDCD